MSDEPYLDGVWAKIARAREHTERLEELTNRFLQRRPNQVTFDNDSEPPWTIIRAVVEPIPLAFSTVAGDLIHNLRSALDHLVWQLVLVSGSEPGRHTAFPLMACESEFDRRVRNPPKDRKGPLHGIDPTSDIWALIERSQPYQPAMRDPLAALPALSNRDKHQGVLVGLSYVQEIDPKSLFDIVGGTLIDVQTAFGQPGVLEHGAEIVRVRATSGKVQMKADPPFQVTVSDGTAHAMSIGSVDRLRSAVVGIVRDAERFF